MADFYGNLANFLLWPSEVDHHGSTYGAGSGLVFLETVITKHWWQQGNSTNCVTAGFTLPSSGGTLSGSVVQANIDCTPEGRALIQGYHVAGASDIAAEFPISATSYVYLKLDTDPSSLEVIRPLVEVASAYRVSASTEVYLGSVTCSSTVVTSAAQRQITGRVVWGSISAASTISDYGSNNWTVSGTDITFSSAFPKTPTIMLTPYYTGSDLCGAYVSAKSTTGFSAKSYRYNAGTPTLLNAFEFVVFG